MAADTTARTCEAYAAVVLRLHTISFLHRKLSSVAAWTRNTSSPSCLLFTGEGGGGLRRRLCRPLPHWIYGSLPLKSTWRWRSARQNPAVDAWSAWCKSGRVSPSSTLLMTNNFISEVQSGRCSVSKSTRWIGFGGATNGFQLSVVLPTAWNGAGGTERCHPILLSGRGEGARAALVRLSSMNSLMCLGESLACHGEPMSVHALLRSRQRVSSLMYRTPCVTAAVFGCDRIVQLLTLVSSVTTIAQGDHRRSAHPLPYLQPKPKKL